MYCRHLLKELHAALREHSFCLPALRNPDILRTHSKFTCSLFSYVVSKSFYFGEWKKKKMKQPEKSTPSAVFVRRMKKCSHPLHQELNSDAAVTLYLLCTIACKLCYYFQVPYHSFWPISVSTGTSYITLLNFGAKGQPESAREDYKKTETEWDLVCLESKYIAAQELPFHFCKAIAWNTSLFFHNEIIPLMHLLMLRVAPHTFLFHLWD